MTKIISLFLITVFFYLQYKLWFGHGGLPEMIRLHQEIAQQEQENQIIQARNQGLQAEVEDLKTGHSAIEERARSQLGMVKQGETFYQIVRPDVKKTAAP
jgi:cell division protein FtsB